MDFKGLDLNLLVAFDALMEERNVTRAASKAVVSHACERILRIRCLSAVLPVCCLPPGQKRSVCMCQKHLTN